jgi:hypothetical protein
MNLLRLLAAIAVVETGDCADHINGRYQLTPVFVRDVNRITGLEHSHARVVQDPLLTIRYVSEYFDHYCNENTLGRLPTVQDYAGIFHAGPTGWKQGRGRDYAQRVANLYETGDPSHASKSYTANH